MSAAPTPAQWKSAVVCSSFKLGYMSEKGLKKGNMDLPVVTLPVLQQLAHGIHAAWSLSVGSFCLVMHSKLEGLQLSKQTLDAYWKARVLEIRAPKKKNKNEDTAVCNSYLFMSKL